MGLMATMFRRKHKLCTHCGGARVHAFCARCGAKGHVPVVVPVVSPMGFEGHWRIFDVRGPSWWTEQDVFKHPDVPHIGECFAGDRGAYTWEMCGYDGVPTEVTVQCLSPGHFRVRAKATQRRWSERKAIAARPVPECLPVPLPNPLSGTGRTIVVMEAGR